MWNFVIVFEDAPNMITGPRSSRSTCCFIKDGLEARAYVPLLALVQRIITSHFFALVALMSIFTLLSLIFTRSIHQKSLRSLANPFFLLFSNLRFNLGNSLFPCGISDQVSKD
eukprot:TRINITY_DN699_c0_g1_i6.p2 TRINITY_DN699_c0_g1~~TRINITY_DN699_c0_g1_i6.p2  ORF type:complete len:113 (+),score=11.30 TRINITY_DN699_c0_g1_i6:414-752(+)